MVRKHDWSTETLHVVLDDATVARLRQVAGRRGIEVEQLIVQAIHSVSWDPGAPPSREPSGAVGSDGDDSTMRGLGTD